MGDTSELQQFFADRICDRNLEPEEIERLAGELAGRPDLWRDQVSHSEDERIYVQLHRDHNLDAWLICWTGTQDTGLHDHDLSSGAVHVVDGALDEDRLRMAGGIATTRYEAGGSFHFDASRIHDVRNAEGHVTVSLHLYSPPIWRMGYYEQGEDGSLARRSYSYAEELRS
ncbi:MAG TPA: cysteine dioxygenase family protein [Gaiellales bacterium]|nr:cysteine dioxygenase family protein [Gaiellales bacterium]